jgi:hypothetical protein
MPTLKASQLRVDDWIRPTQRRGLSWRVVWIKYLHGENIIDAGLECVRYPKRVSGFVTALDNPVYVVPKRMMRPYQEAKNMVKVRGGAADVCAIK